MQIMAMSTLCLEDEAHNMKAYQAKTQAPISQCGPGTARVGSSELTGFLWAPHCLPRLAAPATWNLNLAAGLG